jgi:thiosulfate dehydrogenase
MKNNPIDIKLYIKLSNTLMVLALVMVVLIFVTGLVMVVGTGTIQQWLAGETTTTSTQPAVKGIRISNAWLAPDTATIAHDEHGKLIHYGRELIAHTSEYLGPNGSVMPISNGMNCQNCHLDAGTKPLGNNYSAVASTYPKVRARSGKMESIEKRVNDCFERSLNGKALDSTSHEMRAIVAYIEWLGKDVEKGKTPAGAGLVELAFLDRAASPEQGRIVYEQKCVSCHANNGEGMASPDGKGWMYPPLWGSNSYNNGAGLYRLSRFAGYVKANMPLGATYATPQLTDEEAWDVAAYVNSMYRPKKDLSSDWPDVSKKPIDHPFGPFADGFSDEQHKLGPFIPIREKREKIAEAKK